MLPNFELKADIRYEKVYTTVDWRLKDIDGKVKTISVDFKNNAGPHRSASARVRGKSTKIHSD